MSNDRYLIIFILGVISGISFTLLIVNTTPGTIVYDGKKALQECERPLTREQNCIITAIPKELGN